MKTEHTCLAWPPERACTDYALSGVTSECAYAIVCDGGPNDVCDMDFGVRAVAMAARETMRLVRAADLLPSFFGTYALGKAFALTALYPSLHPQARDVSMLVAWVSGDTLTACLYGNGTLIHKNHAHARVVHVNNQPPDYPTYNLDEARVRKASYLAARAKPKVYYDCIIQDRNESGSVVNSKALEPVVVKAAVQPGDVIMVCSDGIDSFTDSHGSRVDWHAMLEHYLRLHLSTSMGEYTAGEDISVAVIKV